MPHLRQPRPQFSQYTTAARHRPPHRVDMFDLRPVLWMRSAACRSEDPIAFFDRESPFTQARLRRLCATCPVITECLEYALDHDEQGWWGGMTRQERKALQAARAAQPIG